MLLKNIVKVDGDIQRNSSVSSGRPKQDKTDLYVLQKRSTSAEEKKIKSWATTWSNNYIFDWGHAIYPRSLEDIFTKGM